MTPALYYVYRLAAVQKFPHVADLLAEYGNGNELDGWVEYFQEEDRRLSKMLASALGTAKVPTLPAKPVREPEKEPVIDMTDPTIAASFVKFVTGAK